jgi:hypothetical protein
MESIIQAGESSLISALNYAPSDRMANYVQKRESTQFFAPGTKYSPSTSKVIRIDINGSGFLMPDSIVLRATVRNKGAVATNKLYPLTADLACMISEIKVTMGGTEVERITSYNRIHEMLMRGTSTAKRANLASMGFGTADGADGGGTPIAGEGTQKVLARPLCGICNTHNYIPLWLLSTGVQFEITLVDSPGAAVQTGTDKSELWEWEQVSLMCDVVSVSSELMESFAQHTLNGRSLVLSALRSYTTIVFTNSAEQALLTIPRALTRLNAVFVTFVNSEVWVARVTRNWATASMHREPRFLERPPMNSSLPSCKSGRLDTRKARMKALASTGGGI